MTSAPLPIPVEPSRAWNAFIRVLALAAVGLLAYEGLHFFWRDPRHYFTDPTPKSFGDYWANRAWLRLHIAGATVALFTGPFQLWWGFRRRHLRWHRALGYCYLAGVAAGGIGAFRLAAVSTSVDKGISLYVFAAAWWTAVVMAYVAIRGRRIDAHKEWMVRGYVTVYGFVAIRWVNDLPPLVSLGPVGVPTSTWLGWVVPLIAAEVVLQWRRTIGARQRLV